MTRDAFGKKLRQLREERGLKLRKVAETAGISATYLSVLERSAATTPPSERVVFQLADLFGYDRQELLALSGRIPEKVQKILLKHPREMNRLILALKGLSPEQIAKETERIVKKQR